jgi:hypothetical protein
MLSNIIRNRDHDRQHGLSINHEVAPHRKARELSVRIASILQAHCSGDALHEGLRLLRPVDERSDHGCPPPRYGLLLTTANTLDQLKRSRLTFAQSGCVPHDVAAAQTMHRFDVASLRASGWLRPAPALDYRVCRETRHAHQVALGQVLSI